MSSPPRSLRRIATAAALTSLAFFAPSALAAGKVPITFSPTLGADPTGTQQKLAQLEAKLPATFALPGTMQTLTSGKIQLQFFPEAAGLLTRAKTAGPASMTWPPGTGCTKHTSFAAPASLLAVGAAPSCTATEASVRQKLASASPTCLDTQEPERFVLSFAPAEANEQTTGSIESLIGLAGRGLATHALPNGLVTADWVPTLRSILWKLRKTPITSRVSTARAAYAEIASTLTAQAACFEPAARAALAADIATLDAELAKATAAIDKLDADGKIAADHELVCLAAQSRTREALPFPSLTADERRFVAFWLGGVYWRMRGGGLMPLGSTQSARHFFLENPFRRIGELAGGATGNEAGFRVFLNIFDGWGEWMDMGTTAGGQDLYEDLVQMTDRGRQQVADAPVIPGFSAATKYLEERKYDTIDLLAGGLDMGACYAYGLDPLASFRYADVASGPPYGPFIEYFTAIGEFCTGASIALGMTKSLLGGIPNGQPKADLCAARACGDDGCGGSCGTCPSGQTCTSGACVSCVPSCEGKTCGDDGCGGSCGECAGPTSTPPPGAAAPASPGEGGAADRVEASACGCSVPGPRSASGAAASALLAALVLSRRRSRRSRT